MRTFLSGMTFIAMLILVSSCSVFKKNEVIVKGSGVMESKEFQITDYSKIELSNNQEVYYEQRADLFPYLRIETDANVLRYINPVIKKNTLTFESIMAIAPTSYKIYTNSKALAEVKLEGEGRVQLDGTLRVKNFKTEVSGSGIVVLNNIQAKSFNGHISGAGMIEVSGSASKATYDISGSGEVRAENLNANHVICKLSGAGHMWVSALEKLYVNLSGSGDIHYRGKPADLRRKGTGNGQVMEIE